MHTRFENGAISVYSPDNTTNAGVGMMHYAVTTPYSGIPEIVQLLFTLSMLFSVGILGWVFGISLLMNTIVQMIKAVPIMLKMMIGSIQGFVEGLLIAISVVAELLVTITLYTWSLDIIDFIIKLLREVVRGILSIFTTGNLADPESAAILSGLISSAAILWATFQLIKWRRAITISIKSVVTHVLNQVFGTSAQMPTGASQGMMKAAGALAAGAFVASELADQGTLDDVVNDFTDSDLGSSLHDKIENGDYEGALQDIQDYASGNYEGTRGKSETSDAEKRLKEADERIGGAFSANQQSMTDAQKEKEEPLNQEIADAQEEYDQAVADGDEKAQDEALKKLEGKLGERTAQRAKWRQENKEMADKIGVADYGDYLRNQAAGANGYAPLEGAEIPETPTMDGEETTLGADEQAAYTAARDGDGETLRSMSSKFDAQGMDEDDRRELNEMALDPNTSPEKLAEEIASRAKGHFGDNYQDVIDKMNEASGRGSTETYGETEPTSGVNARTMTVQTLEGDNPTMGVTDNSEGDPSKASTVVEIDENGKGQAVSGASFLPEEPNTQLDQSALDAYNAVANNDTEAMKAAAQNYNAWGGTAEQEKIVAQMVANGASSAEIAAACNNFAQDNFGNNYAQVVAGLNTAANRDVGTVTGVAADGTTTQMDIEMKLDNSGNVSYNVGKTGSMFQHQTVTVTDENGQSTYASQATGFGGVLGFGQKAETIVTTDFGSGAGGAGTTYGEVRLTADAMGYNSGNTLVTVGNGSGGGANKLSASEMATAISAQYAQDTSGNVVTGVRMGDMNGQNLDSHVNMVNSVLGQGPSSNAQYNAQATGNEGFNAADLAKDLTLISKAINNLQDMMDGDDDDGSGGTW